MHRETSIAISHSNVESLNKPQNGDLVRSTMMNTRGWEEQQEGVLGAKVGYCILSYTPVGVSFEILLHRTVTIDNVNALCIPLFQRTS